MLCCALSGGLCACVPAARPQAVCNAQHQTQHCVPARAPACRREVALLKINVERAEWDVLAGVDDADWPKVCAACAAASLPASCVLCMAARAGCMRSRCLLRPTRRRANTSTQARSRLGRNAHTPCLLPRLRCWPRPPPAGAPGERAGARHPRPREAAAPAAGQQGLHSGCVPRAALCSVQPAHGVRLPARPAVAGSGSAGAASSSRRPRRRCSGDGSRPATPRPLRRCGLLLHAAWRAPRLMHSLLARDSSQQDTDLHFKLQHAWVFGGFEAATQHNAWPRLLHKQARTPILPLSACIVRSDCCCLNPRVTNMACRGLHCWTA